MKKKIMKEMLEDLSILADNKLLILIGSTLGIIWGISKVLTTVNNSIKAFKQGYGKNTNTTKTNIIIYTVSLLIITIILLS